MDFEKLGFWRFSDIISRVSAVHNEMRLTRSQRCRLRTAECSTLIIDGYALLLATGRPVSRLSVRGQTGTEDGGSISTSVVVVVR